MVRLSFALVACALLAGCAPFRLIPPIYLLRSERTDYKTEWHYPDAAKDEHWLPWYRGGWRRYCLMCGEGTCFEVELAPSTTPCPVAQVGRGHEEDHR